MHQTLTLIGCAGDCAFIRCIKANSLKVEASFETALVLRQLQHTGMLATLKIRRAGYSVRLETQDFHNKFIKFGRDVFPKGSTVHALVEYLNKEVDRVVREMEPEKRPPRAQRADPIRVGRKGKVLCREWFTTELQERWEQKERAACEVVNAWFMGIHGKAKFERKKECYGRLRAPLQNYLHRALGLQTMECAAMREARMEMMRHLNAVKEEHRIAVKAANLDDLLAQIEAQKATIKDQGDKITELEQNAVMKGKVEELEATIKDRDDKIKEQNQVIKQMQKHLDGIIVTSRKLLTAQSTHGVRSPGTPGTPGGESPQLNPSNLKSPLSPALLRTSYEEFEDKRESESAKELPLLSRARAGR